MVDKKHLKIGIAVFAIAALVIGLSVGLTQKSDKSTNNASSSQAYGAYDIDFDTADCVVVNSGSGKSGKSGGGPSADSGKSGKSGDRRALYVPGTEDAEASAGMRRKLRDELLRKLFTFLLRIITILFSMRYRHIISSTSSPFLTLFDITASLSSTPFYLSTLSSALSHPLPSIRRIVVMSNNRTRVG